MLGCRPVSQLSCAIISPDPHRSIVLKRHAMTAPRRDGHDAAQGRELEWTSALGRCAIAQLPVGIKTSNPNRTIVLQRQAV